MVYYRKYVISFLAHPSINSICPYSDVDYEAFISKYFDLTNMRLGHEHLRAGLVYTLESMTKDGFLTKELCLVKLQVQHKWVSTYRLKDKDHFIVQEYINKPQNQYYTLQSKMQ